MDRKSELGRFLLREYGHECVVFDTWACDTHLLNGLGLRVFRDWPSTATLPGAVDLSCKEILAEEDYGATPSDVRRVVADLRRIGLI